MRSIRTKITILTLFAIVAVLISTTVLSVKSIRDLGSSSANQILFLLCEEGQKNLDAHFKSVEQSVETISGYVESDLANTDIEDLEGHIERVRDIFEKTAKNTSSILTYYYRIDPAVSDSAKGFWYVNLDENGFTEHEVTDITLYDTNDQSSLVWFTVPKFTGSSVWLPPYVTDNLDVYVISYNVPIYKEGIFIGVIGIEIDYNTIVDPVDSIELYDNGYAFINDDEGNIIYHPHMDLKDLTGENKPKVPDGLLSADKYIRYSYDGVEKQAVWLPLCNGMRLNVTVPMNEINENWHWLIKQLFIASAILLMIFATLTFRVTKHITDPLRKLTKAAAQVDKGIYDVELDYDGNDEIGILTKTFKGLIDHLKKQIKELNDLAYSDPLTDVHNKGAFNIYIDRIEEKIAEDRESAEFAICIFDCNDLKQINDKYGHKKGDMYLKSAVSLICKVFSHSPVFRVGGDEFAVIIQNENYINREELASEFFEKAAEISDFSDNEWEKVKVAAGIAVYDPKTDRCAEDVIRRADYLMYQNKQIQKEG